MALDYLKSNCIGSVQAQSQQSVPEQKRAPKGYFTKLSLLVLAFIITCVISYHLWMPKVLAETVPVSQGLTAIIYDAPRPSAIIDGQIVYIGDSIGKRKIVKIEAGCVTLKKAQKTYQLFLN